MRTTFGKRAAASAAVTVVAAGVWTGLSAAPAAAAPQLPRLSTTGENFGTFGNHSYCRGAINVGLTSPKRGVVRATLTSLGFSGQGASWKRNPRCKVLFVITHTSGQAFGKETFVTGTFGPRRGQRVVKDVRTGSGVVEFSVVPHSPNSPVRALQGYGYGAYVLVP